MQKKIMIIEESLYEFAKRGKPRKKNKKVLRKIRGINEPDPLEDVEPEEDEELVDDIDVDTSDMTNAEEIMIEEDVYDDELEKALSNEIKIIEPSRRVVRFRLKDDPSETYFGIPMANLTSKTGTAFLFKLEDGKLKKIFLRDMIVEQEKRKGNRALTINE